MKYRRRSPGQPRDPKVVELATYLARCPEHVAVEWLQQHRRVPTDTIVTNRHWNWEFEDEPEWNQVLDAVLHCRRSAAINSALARYGTTDMTYFLQKRPLSKSDWINLASNPSAIGVQWRDAEMADIDIKRAALENPALMLEAMAALLDAKRAGFGGDRKQEGLSTDELALRLYLLSRNEKFRRAASGATQEEESAREYIGFPWSDLKARLGELILELPIQANTAAAITKALSQYSAGLSNQIKFEDPIKAIERWRVQLEGRSDDRLGFFMGEGAYASITMSMVANAAIRGTKEWMTTDHHEAFGGFCHNVRALGSYEGIYPEDLLTDNFQARVKLWKEHEAKRFSSIRGTPNPFWYNEHMWLTPERRRVVRHYTDWYGEFQDHATYEIRLQNLQKKFPGMVGDDEEDELPESQIYNYSMDDVRNDMLTIYNKVDHLESRNLPNSLTLIGYVLLISLVGISILLR
jgi:hypothetical protein